MRLEVLADEEEVAQGAAAWIAVEARAAVTRRGRFVLAVSGGRTPRAMLRALAEQDLPWDALDLFQVDERAAPEGDKDRNLTHLRASLAGSPLRPERIHPMPVEIPDLQDAAQLYAQTLRDVAGVPPVIDLVHLGLGPDGHTASLVPGDPVLDVTDADVAATGVYQGRRRLTLTFPAINRAREVLWVATGAEKASMVARLRDGDRSIPAGRVRRDDTLLVADRAALGQGPR